MDKKITEFLDKIAHERGLEDPCTITAFWMAENGEPLKELTKFRRFYEIGE